jgi:hypothetical protein
LITEFYNYYFRAAVRLTIWNETFSGRQASYILPRTNKFSQKKTKCNTPAVALRSTVQESITPPAHPETKITSLKVEVKVPCASTEHHAMKAYWVLRIELQLHAFLTSALYGGKWSAAGPGCSTPKERTPSSHWIGGWVGPKAGLDAVVVSINGTISCLIPLT